MKPAPYGHIVFGASSVLFGAIALMWHDADTWQGVHRILTLPFGLFLGDALAIAQIMGGALLAFPRATRIASVILIVVYAICALANVPAIASHPAVFGAYDGVFEQVAMLCGAIAAYAATQRQYPAALGVVARIGLGLSTVSFTLAQVFYFKQTAELVPAWIFPGQNFWAILTTVAFALAAIAMLINVRARLAMRLTFLMIALFGIIVWVPILIAHPGDHGNWSEFAMNFLIAGAAAAVAESNPTLS